MTKIKLFLDEDVFPVLSEILRERGYDAVSAKEAGMLAKTDRENLGYATRDKRAVLTFNVSDYVILSRDYSRHYGILVSPQRSLKEILSRLLFFLASHTAEDVRDSFHWL